MLNFSISRLKMICNLLIVFFTIFSHIHATKTNKDTFNEFDVNQSEHVNLLSNTKNFKKLKQDDVDYKQNQSMIVLATVNPRNSIKENFTTDIVDTAFGCMLISLLLILKD